MSRKCAKCSIVSEIEEAFQKSYYSDKIFYCPTCREKDEIQHGESYLIGCLTVLVGGFIWVLISPQNEFAWLVFQIGLTGCFYTVAAVLHELGHVLAALTTKTKVLEVIIGLGKVLNSLDFWGIEWKFCAIPICGLTMISLSKRQFYKIKSFLTSLGGPLANYFLIFVATILLFRISSPWLLAFIRAFIAANVFALLLSLFPKKSHFGGTITSSDGLTLLTIPFMSESRINQEIEAYCVWEGYSYYRRGLFEDAKRSYETALANFPNSLALHYGIGRVFLWLGKYTEARNLFVKLQQSTSLSPAMRIGILNAIATADVMIEGNELLEEADAFSKAAFEKMPWETECKWARGLVLVKKGNTEQGLALLKETADKIENSFQKKLYVSYIADFENKKSDIV